MTRESTSQSLMAPQYDPSAVERRLYEKWENSGYFKPNLQAQGPAFVITIPPPNVTGSLHLGHVLTYGIEDVIGRFKRMQGFSTLIVPGSDHAGIATQNVVEKEIAKEGLTRHDLGRERFVERVWQWKDEYAENIRQGFRRLGCSFDWDRERFTMDERYVDAVLDFFIRLYDEKHIYRGWRVINWCPRCQSAISDIEVEDEEREDTLFYLRYPLSDGSGDIHVATVRPETILGDVAVAVNPQDDRYRKVIGKTAILPLLGRELPIIADDMVEMGFGTGAVKITPAHDFADFEVGERHHLPMPIAIDPQARITAVGRQYEGLTVIEAKVAVTGDLESGGYLIRREQYVHQVPTCERCGTVVEPLLSEQWFMRMEELARPAMDVVLEGKVKFVPERWARIYLDWMEKIRPWTLSRQLWWGHRIPIYYCEEGHPTAGKAWPSSCIVCGRPVVRQDEDVLDTWFSAALWPFAALGWPNDMEDVDRFYPTSFMNTSAQILYLWIARMIMTGLKFMGEVPYPVVLINPTILTKSGQRMSKSLGTGVDPLYLIDQYGADALRFGLITSGSTHQQDIRFSEDRVEQARNFANKVWNIARAIIGNQAPDEQQQLQLTLEDRWILTRMSEVTRSVTADLERFELAGAGQTLHDFLWSEVADWYLEMAKLRLHADDDPGGQATARAVLWSVLERSLRLLHPLMPFLTEEIWQQVRVSGSPAARNLSGWDDVMPQSIMIASWPDDGLHDPEARETTEKVIEIIKRVRTARSEHRVDAREYVAAIVSAGSAPAVMGQFLPIVSRLARLKPITLDGQSQVHREGVVTLLIGDVVVELLDVTDVAAERRRLSKELAGARKAWEDVLHRLEDDSFVSRAPAHVVTRERERAMTLEERTGMLEAQLSNLVE